MRITDTGAPRVSGDEPIAYTGKLPKASAPRVSGDEPDKVGGMRDQFKCSPRERG